MATLLKKLPPGQSRMALDSQLATNAAMKTPKRNAPPGIGAAESIARAKAAKVALGGKGGGASQAPDTTAAKSAALAGAAPSAADLLAGYNLARAKILQGMAPQVQGIYSDATKDLTGVVGGLTDDLKQRLFAAGGGGATASTARGNDFVENDPGALARIAASYEAGPASQAAYTLGAAIPGESLTKQGAAFGAAAAFAPERALQEGQYAIQAALAKSSVSNENLTKVNPSVSKLVGYISDASGNPIPGKDGKPIKITEPGLTPYQKASLGVRESAAKGTQARADRNAQLAEDRAAATDRRFYAGQEFRSAAAADKAREAEKKGVTIDWTASGKTGVLIQKNGQPYHDKQGRTVKFAKPPTAASRKPRSITQSAALDTAAKGMYDGTSKVVKQDDGTYAKVPIRKGLDYQVALRSLRNTYGLSMRQAQNALDTYYTLPADLESLAGKTPKQVRAITRGRPLLSLQERQALKKAGYPARLVEESLFDIGAYARLSQMQVQKRGK